jgi:hypothetical protein
MMQLFTPPNWLKYTAAVTAVAAAGCALLVLLLYCKPLHALHRLPTPCALSQQDTVVAQMLTLPN